MQSPNVGVELETRRAPFSEVQERNISMKAFFTGVSGCKQFPGQVKASTSCFSDALRGGRLCCMCGLSPHTHTDQLGRHNNAGAFQPWVWLQEFGRKLRRVLRIHSVPPLGHVPPLSHRSLSLWFLSLFFVGESTVCSC